MKQYPVTFFALAFVACLLACMGPKSPTGGASTTGADAAAVTTAALAKPPPIRLKYRGTNLSGGEFGKVPGTVGYDYGFPKAEDARYFVERGMNVFRIPFRHERLQPTLRGPLSDAEWARLAEIMNAALGMGAVVILEPHNSARHYSHVLTPTEMGDLWGRIGNQVKARGDVDRIWFNLTNEPHDMATETWVALANEAIHELRRVGYKSKILVPGNGWTGAMHWSSSWYGTPNATAMLNVTDPGNNMAFEVHQYLDQDASGGGTECVSTTIGVERLTGFTQWLRTNGKTAFLGELGAPNTPTCKEAMTKMLALVEEQYDLYWGWTWWSAGYRWPATYQLSIQPIAGPEGALQERPQLSWLRPFLPASCGR